MSSRALDVCIFLLFALALVIGVRRALDLEEQVDLDVIELVLRNRQDQVVLLEYDFVLVAVFARLVHIVEDFVLFLDEKCSLNLSLLFLFIVIALSVKAEVVKLPGGNELLE